MVKYGNQRDTKFDDKIRGRAQSGMNEPSFNPLVRRGQESRPSQPTSPLDAESVRQCGPVVREWRSRLQSSSFPVAVLTYMTDSSAMQPWVLGLSAAARAAPLIVAGSGMRWGGAGVKLPAALRAVQLLAAHAPDMAVVFADGSDTAIANGVTEEATALLRDTVQDSDRVLVSGECGSWPLCYRQSYASHDAFRSCAASRSPACYPNSGLYTGLPAGLLRFLTALDARASDTSLRPPESGDDQAAMHALYGASGIKVGPAQPSAAGSALEHPNAAIGRPQRVAASGRIAMHVDDRQAVFGSLHACKGSGAPRTLRIRGTNFTLCHEGAYEPMRALWRNGTSIGLCTAPAVAASRRGGSSDDPHAGCSAARTRPLFLHASGNHDRLARAFFGERYLQELGAAGKPSGSARSRVVALTRKWQTLFTSVWHAGDGHHRHSGDGDALDGEARIEGGLAALRRHPLLLIDAANGAGSSRTCTLSTVGALEKL